MQVLIESCFDVVFYVSEMLDTPSWKSLIGASKALYTLRGEASLLKRAHPLCYVLKYEIPDLLKKITAIREFTIGLLAENLCKCHLTNDFTRRLSECCKSDKVKSRVANALMASPYMTLDLFKETWLSELTCLSSLASNENIPLADMETMWGRDRPRNDPAENINITAGLYKRSDYTRPVLPLMVMMTPMLGMHPKSICLYKSIIENHKLDETSLSLLKKHNRLSHELYKNPYLTFEELIAPPFEPSKYSWDLLVTLPLLTLKDIEQHPEFPWPVGAKAIASFNPLRRDLILSKKGDTTSLIKAIYSNQIPRLDMLVYKNIAILAGTEVSFEEVLEACSLPEKSPIYHDLCVSLHPNFNLITYFNSKYYINRRGNMGALAHFMSDFPLKGLDEWELFIKKRRPLDSGGILSIKHSLTPSVIRAYPNHNWCLLSVLLRPNQVTMFDVIRLYKEGILKIY